MTFEFATLRRIAVPNRKANAGSLPMTEALMQVLICEQDAVVGMATIEQLRAAHFETLGPIETVDAARKIALHPDLCGAICGLHLADGSSEEVISILRDRGIPVIATTAMTPRERPPQLARLMILQQPYDVAELVAAAQALFPTPVE